MGTNSTVCQDIWSQRLEVRSAKLGRAAAHPGWGLVALLTGVAAFAYGLLAFEHGWRVPMRIAALVVGGVGQLGGLCLIGIAIYLALESLSIGFARGAAEACRGACERALREFKDDARDWASVAEFVAYPEFSRYQGYAESGRALARRWRDLRESLVADGRSLEIERIDATPHAVLGNRLVELVMEVRVPDRTVRLRNAAIEAEGFWFLATLEPYVEPRAYAIGGPVDGTTATRG